MKRYSIYRVVVEPSGRPGDDGVRLAWENYGNGIPRGDDLVVADLDNRGHLVKAPDGSRWAQFVGQS